MVAAENPSLDGLNVLVVEDDFLVARSLRVLLDALGCNVVGPASTAEQACQLIKDQNVDVAILDITLSPGTSAPVARALQYRGRPFVFVTGYGNLGMLPDDLRGYRVLPKPVDRKNVGERARDLTRG